MRPALWLAGCSATLLALSGCQSTIDAARKFAAGGLRAFAARGVTVTRLDRQIKVLGTTVITDPNGTAVVVELRYRGSKPLVDAPIAIDVLSPSGATVFRNNAPGLETALAHVPLLLPGQSLDWVNDQVLPSGKATHVDARVGAGQRAPRSLPAIRVSGAQLTNDPTSGWEATGTVFNSSKITQLRLVVFAVARRGGKVVAAGRAIVARLDPGKRSIFHAFFIGNPQGAQVSVSAPPSVVS